jgi:alanine racemase
MSRSGPWLEVDLDALARNARVFAHRVGVPLLPMVKANAYGIGVVPVVRELESFGPWGYGIATVDEARAIRNAGIDRPLIAFVPMLPTAVDEFLALDLRPVIGSIAGLDAWLGRTERPFHLEIDTGMGRAGIRWHDQAAIAAARDRTRGAVGYGGIFTHFASADTSEGTTATQWDRFQEAVGFLGRPRIVHAANSAAGQWGSRYAGDLARPGIFLYGGRAGALVPEAVVALRARVHAVRPIRAGDPISYGETFRAQADGEVVTLGIGYADGVHRSLGNRGLIAIGGQTYSIAGRVTMDMTMVVTPPGRVTVGQIGTIFGAGVPLDEQAERAGTISYELLTSVGPRVVRRYQGEE